MCKVFGRAFNFGFSLFFSFSMPRTSKNMTTIPCTISTSPPGPPIVINPAVTGSVSGCSKTQSSSSVSVSVATCSPGSGAPSSESLAEKQTANSELFEQFLAFKQARDSMTSQAGFISAPERSVRLPVYNSRSSFGYVAPSVFPHSVNPPTADARQRSNPMLGSDIHGLRETPVPSRWNQSNNSASFLRCAGTRRGGYSEGRSEVSYPRGTFGGVDAMASFEDQPLDSLTNPRLAFDSLGRPLPFHGFQSESPRRSVLFDPSLESESPVIDSDSVDPVCSDAEDSAASAIASEARAMLYRYMGDLYRNTNNEQLPGADSTPGGRTSAKRDCRGLFVDSIPQSDPGISLPEEFVSVFRKLDESNIEKAIPRSQKRAFVFAHEDQCQFFSEKTLAPDVLAFGHSLRTPAPNPLLSREYRLQDRPWASVSESTTMVACLAAYATALADLLVRAEVLGVTDEDCATVRELLLNISSRTYAEALRTQIRATHQRRFLALSALKLPKDFNSLAVARIPRDGPHIFGGKFLDAVDSDISMTKRAKEVALRMRPRSDSFRGSWTRGGAQATRYHSSGRFNSRARGRGFTRKFSARSRGTSRSTTTVPPTAKSDNRK